LIKGKQSGDRKGNETDEAIGFQFLTSFSLRFLLLSSMTHVHILTLIIKVLFVRISNHQRRLVSTTHRLSQRILYSFSRFHNKFSLIFCYILLLLLLLNIVQQQIREMIQEGKEDGVRAALATWTVRLFPFSKIDQIVRLIENFISEKRFRLGRR
jgi:hypothetical protein